MATMIRLHNSTYRISKLYFNQMGIRYSTNDEEKKTLIVNSDHIRFIRDFSENNYYTLNLTIDGTTGFIIDLKYDSKEAYEHDLELLLGNNKE